MKKHLFLAAFASINLSACATVVNGTKDTLRVSSTPNAANVKISDISGDFSDRNCTTPCELELNRKKTYDVTVSKDGFSPYNLLVEPKLTAGNVAASTGNVLVGGIIGIGVDHATGAGRDLHPNPVIFSLQPTGTASFRTDIDNNKITPVEESVDDGSAESS